MRRISNKWMNGMLQIPGGHVEVGESPTKAILREANEELGINLNVCDIKFLAVVQVNEDGNEYVAYQFILKNPETFNYKIQEIEKCSEIIWVELSISRMPIDIIPFFREVIKKCVIGHNSYAENGY